MKKFYKIILIIIFTHIIIYTQTVGTGPSYNTIVVKNGRVYTWGDNFFGQLGNGTTTSSNVPIQVNSNGVLAGKTITSVGIGEYFSVALASDGTVYTWGDNANGNLGDGTNTNSYVPVAVNTSGVLAGKTIVSIASGTAHVVALASDGKVYTWGNNYYGQLGIGTNLSTNVPVAVSTSGVLAGKTIVSVAAGGILSMAVASDGTVYTWGANYYGQLGNGNTTNSNLPVAVSTSGALSGKFITSVATDDYHSVALASDGTVYTWGYNHYGQLGNGTATNSNVPVAVSTSGTLSGKIITSIAAGLHHTIALASDGTVYAWGYNYYGQLGIGTLGNSFVPVAVSTSGVLAGKTIISIGAGYYHTIALASNGTFYTWGWNNWGQLGDGTNNDSNVPISVKFTTVLGVKVFLEGPYSSGAMSNSLGSSIPTSQPYSVSPWAYNGSETTTSSFITTNNIVDWVYIELRSGSSASTATTIVGKTAALLRNDGVILDTDGTTEIKFSGVSPGNYYLAVFHRNHLPIISSQTVAVN